MKKMCTLNTQSAQQQSYCCFKTRVSITDGCFDKSSADCCLTSLFSLFRVCVKKSSQERLALKILIDRPKARNEVRGNTATVVAERWLFACGCCQLSPPISNSSSLFFRRFSGSLRFDLCRAVFLHCASQLLRIISGHVCSGRAAHTPGRGAVKTDGHTL